jgi:hypothetical protein
MRENIGPRANRHFVPGHVWHVTHRYGVVIHPDKWPHGGYNEIQRPRRKKILIDSEALGHLSGFNNCDEFQSAHRNRVEALRKLSK